MKKSFFIIFLCIVAVCFVSCEKNNVPEETTEGTSFNLSSGEASDNVSISVMAGQAAVDITFSETLESQEDAAIYTYRMADYASASCGYCGSATAEQVVFFTIHEGQMEQAKKAVSTQLAYLAENYASYAPDEVPKLNNAVIKDYGDILVVCVSSDSNAEAKLDKILN